MGLTIPGLSGTCGYWGRSLAVLVEFFVKQDDSQKQKSMLQEQQARCEERLSALRAEASAAENELADAMVCWIDAFPLPSFEELKAPKADAIPHVRAGSPSYCPRNSI